MVDTALHFVSAAATSPWAYFALFVLAALDGFFPAVPGETALVAVAVFATGGDSSLLLTILAGAAGVFAGDHTSYFIGRGSIGQLQRRLRAGTRGRLAFDWASQKLDERGGVVLLASRFIPGVRTATTMTMGAVNYPLRFFSLFDSVASLCWATGWSLVGYVGGAAFQDDPMKGLLLGLGLALAITVLAEVIRYLRKRSRGRGERVRSTNASSGSRTLQ